jgi:hypothetical protein
MTDKKEGRKGEEEGRRRGGGREERRRSQSSNLHHLILGEVRKGREEKEGEESTCLASALRFARK